MELFWLYVSWFLFGYCVLATGTAFYLKRKLDTKIEGIDTHIVEITTELKRFNDGRSGILTELSSVTEETKKINETLKRYGMEDKVNRAIDPIDDSPQVVKEFMGILSRYNMREKSRNIDRY